MAAFGVMVCAGFSLGVLKPANHHSNATVDLSCFHLHGHTRLLTLIPGMTACHKTKQNRFHQYDDKLRVILSPLCSLDLIQ